MDKITILGEIYNVQSVIEKVSIADSFVLSQNKIGGGNGEAKLYIGQTGEKLEDFFGSRSFIINCFLSKRNLLRYLDDAYSEYIEPQQEYRFKNSLPEIWESRKLKVLDLPDVVNFSIQDQNQLLGPRLYINSINLKNDIDTYKLIRELALPVISHLNIYKLENILTKNILYYFKLFFNDKEYDLEPEINLNEKIDDTRFIPNSEESLEKELREINTSSDIKIPFDPNKIKVRTSPSTVGQIVNDLEDDFINLDTEFQRLPNLWDLKKKSRFIESLLLKLPIPAFYFNEKEENNLEVIDGLQRISSIKSFVIDKNFTLQELEFLTEYNGYSYDLLPSTLSRRIITFPITTYIIEKGTPNEVKFNIFKRVNTGGLVLTAQEIRHAINQGAPSKLIAELVRWEDSENVLINGLKSTREGKAFAKATDGKVGSFRMEDRDFATRFVSFYLIPYQEYKPDLDTFLNNGMVKIKELSETEITKLKDSFFKAMQLAYDIWQEDAFRKRFKKSDSRKPINKALFEVLSVNFAKLSDDEILTLKSNKKNFIRKFISLHNEDANFLRSISQGTAQKESVIKRFVEIEKIIKETLAND